jgi:hypothetical protein
MDSGRGFLLIFSRAYLGLIACKVSAGLIRYERMMDFGNREQRYGSEKAGSEFLCRWVGRFL